MYRILRLVLLLGALAAAACHDGPFGEPAPGAQLPPSTTTLAALQQLAGSTPFTVTGDLVVSGIVTSSDRRLAFYHTLHIESEGAALAVLAGVDRLHADYPVGCRVAVRLQGLTLGRYRGVLQAGTQPEPGSYYPVGYLASPAAVAEHLFRADEALQPLEPTLRTVAELQPAMGGTLVRIEGLVRVPEPEPDAETDASRWSGSHAFADAAGNIVYSYVRSGAAFADTEIPARPLTLVGILLYEAGADRYLIQMRDEADIY